MSEVLMQPKQVRVVPGYTVATACTLIRSDAGVFLGIAQCNDAGETLNEVSTGDFEVVDRDGEPVLDAQGVVLPLELLRELLHRAVERL